jgi:hypothetical protein
MNDMVFVWLNDFEYEDDEYAMAQYDFYEGDPSVGEPDSLEVTVYLFRDDDMIREIKDTELTERDQMLCEIECLEDMARQREAYDNDRGYDLWLEDQLRYETN